MTAIVLCDDKTRRDGPHELSVHEYADGTPIAFHTLATAVLDDPTTNIVEADVNEHGVVEQLGDAVLNHGRNKRFATPDQKLALTRDASQLSVPRLRHAVRPLRTTPSGRIPAPRPY